MQKYLKHSCTGADWHLYPNDWSKMPGCYLRGTKIVYLTLHTSVTSRAKVLVKMANYSEAFWRE
jgi:hypothetical protein